MWLAQFAYEPQTALLAGAHRAHRESFDFA